MNKKKRCNNFFNFPFFRSCFILLMRCVYCQYCGLIESFICVHFLCAVFCSCSRWWPAARLRLLPSISFCWLVSYFCKNKQFCFFIFLCTSSTLQLQHHSQTLAMLPSVMKHWLFFILTTDSWFKHSGRPTRSLLSLTTKVLNYFELFHFFGFTLKRSWVVSWFH